MAQNHYCDKNIIPNTLTLVLDTVGILHYGATCNAYHHRQYFYSPKLPTYSFCQSETEIPIFELLSMSSGPRPSSFPLASRSYTTTNRRITHGTHLRGRTVDTHFGDVTSETPRGAEGPRRNASAEGYWLVGYCVNSIIAHCRLLLPDREAQQTIRHAGSERRPYVQTVSAGMVRI